MGRVDQEEIFLLWTVVITVYMKIFSRKYLAGNIWREIFGRKYLAGANFLLFCPVSNRVGILIHVTVQCLKFTKQYHCHTKCLAGLVAFC